MRIRDSSIKNAEISPFDTPARVWQHHAMMTETRNQFSVTRAVSKTGGGTKKQCLISWSEVVSMAVVGVKLSPHEN